MGAAKKTARETGRIVMKMKARIPSVTARPTGFFFTTAQKQAPKSPKAMKMEQIPRMVAVHIVVSLPPNQWVR